MIILRVIVTYRCNKKKKKKWHIQSQKHVLCMVSTNTVRYNVKTVGNSYMFSVVLLPSMPLTLNDFNLVHVLLELSGRCWPPNTSQMNPAWTLRSHTVSCSALFGLPWWTSHQLPAYQCTQSVEVTVCGQWHIAMKILLNNIKTASRSQIRRLQGCAAG